MKLMHISDLHLGKRLNEFSLIEDQRYILQEIVALVRQEQPAVLLIAGDIYDKSIPPVEAVQLFDGFLNAMAKLGVPVGITIGNHDSAERLSFGAQLLQQAGVHVSTCYDGEVQRLELADEHGPVIIYLLPFLKPIIVRHALAQVAAAKASTAGEGGAEQGVLQFDAEEAAANEAEEQAITSYHEAVQAALGRIAIDTTQRNILVAHQYVTGASPAGSESINVNVGGLDNVGAEAFADFDYVALGHIHGAQNITVPGRSTLLHYSGTPLKYSFKEVNDTKSVTIIELGEKGKVELNTLPLTPLRELRKLRGTYEELMTRTTYAELPVDSDGRLKDFFHITLTDEKDVPEAVAKLRSVYKNLLELTYDNRRTRNMKQVQDDEKIEEKSSLELVSDFYKLQNGGALEAEPQRFVQALLERLEEKEAKA